MTPSQKTASKSKKQDSNGKFPQFEKRILDTSSIGVLITRMSDGTILYANQAIAGLLGLPDTGEITGKPVPNLYWDAKERETVLGKFRAEGSVRNYDLRARRADGSMTWVSISIQPFDYEGEQVLLSEISDITSRKQAEEAQRASEEQFRSLYNNSTIGLYRTTPDGRILMINPTGLRLLGFDTFEEMSKRNLEQSGFEEQDARKKFREKLEREGVIEQESVWTRKDGTPIFVREGAAVSRDENGNALYYDGSFEDITAYKQAEKDLLLRDRALASSLNAVILLNISDNKPIYVNDALLKMTGYTREEVMQIGLSDITGNADEPRKIREAIQTKGFFVGEELLKRKDGSVFPANFFSSLIIGAEGRPIAVQTSFFDISEGKQAEEALRESEERFRRFTEATIEGLVFHEQGKVIDANPAALAMFGLSRSDEFIGRNLMEFIIPESRQLVLQQMQLETVHPYEIQCIRTDGSIFPVETSTRIYKVGEHTIRASAVRDISVRKNAEKALAESEAQFRSLFDQSADAVLLLENGLFTDCNQSTVQMMHAVDKAQFLSLHPSKLSPEYQPDGRPSGEKADEMIRIATEKGSHRFEWVHRRVDGTDIPVEVLLTPIVMGNRTVIHTVWRDIAERKQAEELLQKSEANLSSAFRVANMGHWEFDVPTQMFTFNDQYYSLHGTTAKEAGGYQMSAQTFAQQYVYPEDASTVGHTIQQAVETTDPNFQIQTEARIMRAGEPRWIRVWFRIEKDKQGQTVKLHGVNQDITERKQAEQSIRESEQRFRGMAETMVDGLTVFEGNQVVFMNDRLPQILGYSKEELSHMSSFDYASSEELEGLKQRAQQARETGKPLDELAFWAIRKDGERCFVRNRYAAMYDSDQKVVGRIIVTTDETERKQFETNLQRRVEIETLLTTISSKFVTASAHNMDEQITQALELLGKFANTDRSYLFMFAENGLTMDNTHEWCAEGIESHINNLKGVPVDTFPWLMERLKKFEVVSVPLVAELPAQAGAEKAEFQAEGIQSIIVVPIIYQGRLVGFMGFDAVSHQRDWETDTATVLRTSGETFITTIERIRLQKEVEAAFERRGYQVQVSTEISQEVAAASGLSDLFERVVTLAKERLGYYHTQLLRYDATQDAVVLINGYGETGRKMLEGGHKMPMGSGLIGTAAATGETVMRSALQEDIAWQPNPLLPDTRGEIAVPIKWQDNVLGVLDVQSDRAGALTEDDRLLLEGLCGQVAVAMEQTRLRSEMAERLEEVNRLYRTMSHEGWKTYRETAELPNGFVFDQAGVRPVEETPLDTEAFTSIPMKVLGGEVVGNLAVANDPQHPMSPEDITFLQQVSDQVALALEGARLAAQTQSALAQTEKLSDAGLRFNQAADLQELVKIAVETLGIPQINRAALETFNYNAEGEMQSMDVIANWWSGTGPQPTLVGMRYTPSSLPLLQMFLTPTPIFITDIVTDERVDSLSLQVIRKLDIHAVAVLPLFQASQQIGVLLLESDKVHEFNQDEIRLYSAMGPQISTVLENRRQFERAQQQAEREGMLNIISQKIQSATTVEAVLQIAARELGHALGAPMTIARLNLKGK